MKALNLYTVLPVKDRLIKLHGPKEAYLYFYNKRLNLLSNVWENFDFNIWLQEQKFRLIDHGFENRIIHFYYELGFLFEININHEMPLDTPLVMDIHYNFQDEFKIKKNQKKPKFKNSKETKLSRLRSKNLKKAMMNLNKEIVISLISLKEFIYQTSSHSAQEFIDQIWFTKKNRGRFGSATYIEATGELLLSNSPECLFQYEKNTMVTRPIKGTFKLSEISELKTKWR